LLCINVIRVSLEQHEVECPIVQHSATEESKRIEGFTKIPDWSWVVSPNFINVAAVTKQGEWLVFNQTKYAIQHQFNSQTLAIVGGYIEPDNTNPIENAKRELLEETGYESKDWSLLNVSVTDANRGCGVAYLYLALDCEKSSKKEVVSDDLEEQQLILLSTAEIEEALAKNYVKCVTWVATLALGLLKYKQHAAHKAN
jgi:ADP-ribose pyrophosphatase